MSDWRDEALRLRDEGLSVRKIAARIGKSKSVVGELLSPSRCACGEVKAHESERCLACHRVAEDEAARELIAEYLTGDPLAVIAERRGKTPASVRARIAYLRTAGYEFPHRYRMTEAGIAGIRAGVVRRMESSALAHTIHGSSKEVAGRRATAPGPAQEDESPMHRQPKPARGSASSDARSAA